MSVAKLSITFFLQMAVILAACRLVGWLGQKYLKQPQVVCEMIAGVLLGPSLFGTLYDVTSAPVAFLAEGAVMLVGGFVTMALAPASHAPAPDSAPPPPT